MDRSGFSAPAGAYQRLGRAGYRALTKSLADSAPPISRPAQGTIQPLPLGQGHWANSASLRKKAIDHILGRPPSAVERSKQEESVWISATRNLNWAIWDISRRLAFAYASALPDPAIAPHDGNSSSHSTAQTKAGQLQVHLSIIKIDPPARPGDKTPPANLPANASAATSHGASAGATGKSKGEDKGPSEMWIRPRDVLSSALDTIPMNALEHRDCMMARNRAGLCEEVLFYGRIFGGSVLADFVFTANALPFSLPGHLYRPLSIEGNNLPGWLQRVRWDPLADKPDWPGAKDLINHGIYGFPTAWHGQPVLHIASHWPNKMYRSQAMSMQRSNYGRSGQGGHVISHRWNDQPPRMGQRFGSNASGRAQYHMNAPPSAALYNEPRHIQYGPLRDPMPQGGHHQAVRDWQPPSLPTRLLYRAHVPVPVRAALSHDRHFYSPLPSDMHHEVTDQGRLRPAIFHRDRHVYHPPAQGRYRDPGTYYDGGMYAAQGTATAPERNMYGPRPGMYDYGLADGDLMGPEAWERQQMARAEAMLIDLQLH